MFPLMKWIKYLTGFSRQRSVMIAAITMGVVFIGSISVKYLEQQTDGSNIHSVWDGIWWAMVTVATVGYGDRFPVSVGGRVVGFLLMFFGVGMMSLLTATVASIFVEKKIMQDKGLETVKIRDHIIICGWNGHTEEVLGGLTERDSKGAETIVLINELSVDELETLRLKYRKDNLKFLRGDYVREDVLLRAKVTHARFVVIMADVSGGHALERADERTTMAALAIKYLAPKVKTIAELLDGENRQHLKRANVEEIIVRGEHIGSLLVTAVKSPGLPKLIANMLSLGNTNRLWRVEIPKSFIGGTFLDLSTYYREKQQAILIGFLKEKQSMRLEDILSDNTSMIDNFIREKLRETQKDFYYEKDETRFVVNPHDGYIIDPNDYAVVLSKSMPQ